MRNKKGGRTESEINNLELENLDNGNNTLAVPITKILSAKKKYTARENKLKGMTWGMGLEHECQFFYIPKNTNTTYSPENIVLFNSLEPTTNMLNDQNFLSQHDRDLLLKLDFELTGRKCHGKVVLEKTPIAMPEFITEYPFSNISNPRNIYNYFSDLIEKEKRFLELMYKYLPVFNFIDKKYDIYQYPFGMCSDIRIRKDYESMNSELEKKKYIDYCGSFHFTITLPFKKKNSYSDADQKEFRDNHYNFGAMFQWMEPLLLAAFFSCDQDAVGSAKKRIKGSFRVARVGWGNFAGSDMRKKNTGVGRYANVIPYWRKNFDFFESNIVDSCMKPNPKLKEPQAVSSFSSNIRTFGPDPNNPDERISGAEMKIPNGLEFRIFDHFDSQNLIFLMEIVILIAANSYRNKVKKFVYEDEHWIKTLQNIMINGWKAKVDPVFIQKLENELKISIIDIKSYRAYDILVAVVDELYKQNKDSDVVFMMCGKLNKPFVPQINKYSWEFAFLLKLLKDKNVYEKYLKFLQKVIVDDDVKKLKQSVVSIFGENWKNNVEDVLWFFNTKGMIEINKDETKYKVNKKNIEKFVKLDDLTWEAILQLNIFIFPFRSFSTNPAKKERNAKIEKEIKDRYKDLVNFNFSWRELNLNKI